MKEESKQVEIFFMSFTSLPILIIVVCSLFLLVRNEFLFLCAGKWGNKTCKEWYSTRFNFLSTSSFFCCNMHILNFLNEILRQGLKILPLDWILSFLYFNYGGILINVKRKYYHAGIFHTCHVYFFYLL